ncbi:hypothetical protein ACFWAR_30420 [Streptomyces sp. NPDC059917]|uniref:hypothetical protein n=1 Tax=Streptomyces sp. NPDC059917 TaxID=3347002 RepID=UPI0036479997
MEWGTVIAVLIGGLIGLGGDAMGRIGARRQARTSRLEHLEDVETARRQAVEDEGRREKRDREMRAVERILSAYLENPIGLVNQLMDATVLSITEIVKVLGFEQSFILDGELRQRITEICHFLDLASVGDVGAYSSAEVGFLARNETRMLLGAWVRGERLPDSIEGWDEIRRGRAEIDAQWQQKLHEAGLRVRIPPLSIY